MPTDMRLKRLDRNDYDSVDVFFLMKDFRCVTRGFE